MKILILCVFVNLIFFQLKAQITFQKNLPGGGSYACKQTPDTGYIVGTGNTLVKTDKYGDTLWTKSLTAPFILTATQSLALTWDGGYIVTGYTSTIGWAGFVVRTNSLGDTLWTKKYEYTTHCFPHSIIQTSDSAFLVGGRMENYSAGTYGSALLMKLDNNGDTLWYKIMDWTESSDAIYSMQETSDGGFILSGNGNNGFFLIKVNSSGAILWRKNFPDLSGVNMASSVWQTFDGGFIATGETWNLGMGGSDVFLLKTNSTGITSWIKTFGLGANEGGKSVQQCSDSGFICTGYTSVNGYPASPDVFLLKTDISGNTEWEKTFGKELGDYSTSVAQTFDGGFIIGGTMSSAVPNKTYLIKTGIDGSLDGVDIGACEIDSIPFIQCAGAYSPHASVINYSRDTLHKAFICYKVDTFPIDTTVWTGVLLPLDTLLISLPGFTVPVGDHTIKIFTFYPNDTIDYSTCNDTSRYNFVRIDNSLMDTILSEGFEFGGFPSDWVTENVGNNPNYWLTCGIGGFGTSSKSALIQNYNHTQIGWVDNFFPSIIDLSSAITPLALMFDVAHAMKYGTENNRLQVFASVDCGVTWNSLYNKDGLTLSTAPATTGMFVPNPSQWRLENVNMDAYAGEPEVLFKFQTVGDGGNDLYIDNINLISGVSISDDLLTGTNINIYPNPSANDFSIDLINTDQPVQIFVYDASGKTIEAITSTNTLVQFGKNYIQGIYFVNVIVGNDQQGQKIVKM